MIWALFALGNASTINANCSYDRWIYVITASAGTGGSISPSGKVYVWRNASRTFNISANSGYEISDVLVDGESQGAVSSYTFSKVNSDHTISATFSPKEYTVTATADYGGEISPSGGVTVAHGSDQTFIITANEGNDILDVLVDGVSVGPVSSYTFADISSDHTISVTFDIGMEVLNVTIPNGSMKIGDVITATITVDHDDGIPYTFISGSVGGYPLEGFQRISATIYQANFSITQGGNSYSASQDIPVSDLIISKGADLSPPYNLPIVQNSDPIDAKLPVINSMQVAGGNMKIGDVVILTINADDIDYSPHPLTTINGVAITAPNVTFSESGDGNYTLSYTIQEGDTDVGPALSELEVTVILVKPSGNTGLPYSTVTNASQLTIDAHAPEVTAMEVPSIEVGVGGSVKVTVTADGMGYTAGTGTMINGVSLASSRVTFTELSDGMYELSYLVIIDDDAVAPGTLQASIVLTDPAGNVGEPYLTLEENNLEIYTDLPEATLAGTAEICEGEEAELIVFLSGRSPWSFDLNDGTTTTSFTNIESAEYEIIVTPVQTTAYEISSVTDVNGVENTNAGNVQVTVNETSDVEITNLAAGYHVEADPVKLEANVPGGTFSGPGVFSETGYFYPDIADTVNSPHTIYYTYTNDNGCSTIASKLVYVLGAKGSISIPGNTICVNDDPFIVAVLNVPVETGSFRLLNSASQPVSGLTDNGDNTATIDPASLSLDNYTIEYRYFDVADIYLNKTFIVEPVDQPLILNLNESSYCQSAPPFVLQSNLENVLFEGPGISGNVNDGFTFNPGETDPGNISITCTFIADNGCTASTRKSVQIVHTPEVKFEISSACIPEGGEIVTFDNQTNEKSSVEIWSWDFGDISSENNQSNLVDPTHFYQEPGQRSISLTATTFDGCVATFVLDATIDNQPVADFTWISDCVTNGSVVKFVNSSTYGSSSIDTTIWTFKTSGGDLLDEIGSNSPDDTIAFPFTTVNNYLVDLYTINSAGCSNELTKEIRLRPTIQLGSEGYHENFDTTEGLWTIHSEDKVESWVWDVPDFNGYTQVPGDKAWFTQLPSGIPDYKENSWIQSPCFDFTGIDRPMIQMDIMRSFVPEMNGAVLQYQDVIEEGWKTVGEQTPGIGWYNAHNIQNKPGGSNIGWGLDLFNPDTEWVTAVHDLDQLTGNQNVAFRIVIATNGGQEMDNQGFAFDNTVIAERSKLTVLEHFTDCSEDSSRLADDIIDAIWNIHSKDVIDLQYHMSYHGIDPMNKNNPDPASTRSFNYGVPQIPYTVLDGGINSSYRYDFSDLKRTPVENHLKLLTLETPAFDIDLSVDWMNSGLEANTTVTCMTDRFDENIQLYLVVFETSVTAYTGRNGDTHFRNVVLDMLPTPAGKLLGDKWYEGKSDLRTNFWTYKPYVENIGDLAVAAFVQDRSNGQILQAAVDHKKKIVGVPDPVSETGSLNIYPNPVQSTLYVNLGARRDYCGRIELVDISGKVVLSEHLPSGYQIFQLDIAHLNRGIYILRWVESGQVRGVSKVVKSRM
ncbi:MAG: T9SS type A sorting domain-containing protein [Bacteroidota bacterium]